MIGNVVGHLRSPSLRIGNPMQRLVIVNALPVPVGESLKETQETMEIRKKSRPN